MANPSSSASGHSDVVVFPPVIPVTGFLIGVLLEWALPLRAWIPQPWQFGIRVAGLAVLIVGVAGFLWMVATMRAARTPIHNAKTPTALVENGPFRWSRNPMYLFGSVAYAGLAMALLLPWSFALLAAVAVAMHYGVVLREEAFLERRFGESYLRYKTRTPRSL